MITDKDQSSLDEELEARSKGDTRFFWFWVVMLICIVAVCVGHGLGWIHWVDGLDVSHHRSIKAHE